MISHWACSYKGREAYMTTTQVVIPPKVYSEGKFYIQQESNKVLLGIYQGTTLRSCLSTQGRYMYSRCVSSPAFAAGPGRNESSLLLLLLLLLPLFFQVQPDYGTRAHVLTSQEKPPGHCCRWLLSIGSHCARYCELEAGFRGPRYDWSTRIGYSNRHGSQRSEF